MPSDILEQLTRITISDIVALVHAGLATVHPERVVAGRKTTEVARVRITDAGRRILERGRV
jgi:hypothetical protein